MMMMVVVICVYVCTYECQCLPTYRHSEYKIVSYHIILSHQIITQLSTFTCLVFLFLFFSDVTGIFQSF